MTFPKILAFIGIILFGTIAIAAVVKRSKGTEQSAAATTPSKKIVVAAQTPIEIDINVASAPITPVVPPPQEKPVLKPKEAKTITKTASKPAKIDEKLPEADRIAELFNKGEPKLPIVETITYRSRVPWQKGRPAWLSDYASYYSSSRHFIARSLNGKPDYFKQDVAEGDRFNVLRPDKNINFHLLIDMGRSKMWFYYVDLDTQERVLLKTYRVGLGRQDSTKASGSLTPVGKYSLGSKIAIYKPKMTGFHNGQKVEMIRIFGTRWIPFEKEISNCSAPAKGFGIHGVPWLPNEKGEFVEQRESLEKSESDGCVRMATEDMEEIFAIVITKPTYIELVKDFYDAKLPGIEKK